MERVAERCRSSLTSAHAVALHRVNVASNESRTTANPGSNSDLPTVAPTELRATPTSRARELHVPPSAEFACGSGAVNGCKNIHSNACCYVRTDEASKAELLGFALYPRAR